LLKVGKPREKLEIIKKGIEVGIVWWEEFTKNFIEYINHEKKFNDYGTITKKAKRIKGLPIREFYSIIRDLKINHNFLHSFLRLRNKFINKEILNYKKLTNILLVTRNDEDFVREFLNFDYCKDMFEKYSINFIPIGNKFLSNDGIYNGKIKTGKNASLIISNGDLVDKKTKSEIYKSRIVFGDNEEWLALNRKAKAMVNVQTSGYMGEKQIENASNIILNLYSEFSPRHSEQPKFAFFSSNNSAVYNFK